MKSNHSLEHGVCIVRPSGALNGVIRVPGDKSISHRAVMLGGLAHGKTTIHGFLESEDCIATLKAFERMGVLAARDGGDFLIQGAGAAGLQEPDNVLDMGNSGTGSRLLLGVLAGQPFTAVLTGDSSLRSRPMARVTNPLSEMGACFMGRKNGTLLPLTVQGGKLKGIQYKSPVASAQIKSAILLAGLFAEGETAVHEPGPSRDHTERMLQSFGVEVKCEPGLVALQGNQILKGHTIDVPGDISSAAFFMVAAAILPDSDLLIEGVGVNPTRTGILEVLQEMGADISIQNERMMGAEPVADIRVRHSELRGVRVSGETVVRMIDEFPIFAVAAAYATSESVVEGAEELRVKESDRITAVVNQLKRMGADLQETPDGFTVKGGGGLRGAEVMSLGDHRIAMSAVVAALAAQGETKIQGTAPVATSFPNFFELMNSLQDGCVEVKQ
ncbi:MAG: 3-phosphoshikimate 1-carboxyvinyltransferase [Candidatus Hinthialibacter antarcticus]|nr:3-phosphoshikimate 1-carboxyvinyltransferase [Candidatus Hinthialibacter antarcticus]